MDWSPLEEVTTILIVLAVFADSASSFDAEPLVTVFPSTVIVEAPSPAVGVTLTPVTASGALPEYQSVCESNAGDRAIAVPLLSATVRTDRDESSDSGMRSTCFFRLLFTSVCAHTCTW